MHDRDDGGQSEAALSDPCDVATHLGLKDRARRQAAGIHVKCPARDDSGPSCSLTRGRDGTLRVVCFGDGCDRSGNVFVLIGAVECLDVQRDFSLLPQRAVELAGVDPERRPRRCRPPSRPPVAKSPPPMGEVRALRNARRSCADADDAATWLRSRVRGSPRARSRAPGRSHRLALARFRREADARTAWVALGHRVIVPMCDAAGELRAERGALIRPESRAVAPVLLAGRTLRSVRVAEVARS